MYKRIWIFALILTLGLSFAFIFACGDDDDDDDDDDDADEGDDDETEYEDGTCEGYCAKLFDCNAGAGFADEAACAENCETMPDRDCFLTCDPSISCGDFMDCMAACG